MGCIISDVSNPLICFLEGLSQPIKDPAALEDLERVTVVDLHVDVQSVVRMQWGLVESLVKAYGVALQKASFSLAGSSLPITPGLTSAEFDEFKQDIQDASFVNLNLEIDKSELIRGLCGDADPNCRMTLFFFPEALERYLREATLEHLEKLWGENGKKKAILLVPSLDVMLEGNSKAIAVIGGRHQNQIKKIAGEQPDWSKIEHVRKECLNNTKWSNESWTVNLTPYHLQIDPVAQKTESSDSRPEGSEASYLKASYSKVSSSNVPKSPPASEEAGAKDAAEQGRIDRLTRLLQIHQINCILMFLADRTTGELERPLRITFAGEKNIVEMDLAFPGKPPHRQDPVYDLEGIKSLFSILDWAYMRSSVEDRLPLVQISVVQALQTESNYATIELLLKKASNIREGLDWHWKAFIEGKVEAYIKDVKELEDYLDGAVTAFASEITSMVKSLSDTVLAAVGVVLGTFIAAIFSKSFDETIFKIGMIVYAAYVLIFPCLLSMLNQWQRYEGLCEDFDRRRMRFEARLQKETVAEVVGERISSSKTRFEAWFVAVVVAYLMIVLLSWQASSIVPQMMGNPTVAGSVAAAMSP